MTLGAPPAEVVVTPELVRALLAEQDPAYAELPVRFAGEGWDNFMFRLGDALAVRLPRRAIGAELILNEQRWLGVVAKRLPVAVPTPVAIGKPARGYPWSWSVIPWIDGAPVDRAPLDRDQGPALARFLDALHQPAPPDAPVNPARGVPLEARSERLLPCLDRLRASSDLITPAIDRALRDALAAPHAERAMFVHGDLHAQNMLAKDGALCGVVDWGDMCSGDPAVDLASIWGVLGERSARDEALSAYGPDAALLARAKGWAIFFGAVLFETGLTDSGIAPALRGGDRGIAPALRGGAKSINSGHAAMGEATLRRLEEGP